MSFIINWNKLSSLESSIISSLNNHLSSITLPPMLSSITCNNFSIGSIEPTITLTNLSTPYPSFYTDYESTSDVSYGISDPSREFKDASIDIKRQEYKRHWRGYSFNQLNQLNQSFNQLNQSFNQSSTLFNTPLPEINDSSDATDESDLDENTDDIQIKLELDYDGNVGYESMIECVFLLSFAFFVSLTLFVSLYSLLLTLTLFYSH